MTKVIVRNSVGQIQFVMQVKEPRSRVVAELIPALEKGGAEDGWKASIEAKPGFAVVGSDGMSLVVWGCGDTRKLAFKDASRWLEEAGAARELDACDAFPISSDVRSKIEAGTIDPVALGIFASKSEATGYANRLQRRLAS